MASLVAAYGTIGYKPCHDGTLEDDIEKITIYGSEDDKYTHAAIQRENGRWGSKCGELWDIEHDSLDHVLCEAYGIVKCFVARPRKATNSEQAPSKHSEHETDQPKTSDAGRSAPSGNADAAAGPRSEGAEAAPDEEEGGTQESG